MFISAYFQYLKIYVLLDMSVLQYYRKEGLDLENRYSNKSLEQSTERKLL